MSPEFGLHCLNVTQPGDGLTDTSKRWSAGFDCVDRAKSKRCALEEVFTPSCLRGEQKNPQPRKIYTSLRRSNYTTVHFPRSLQLYKLQFLSDIPQLVTTLSFMKWFTYQSGNIHFLHYNFCQVVLIYHYYRYHKPNSVFSPLSLKWPTDGSPSASPGQVRSVGENRTTGSLCDSEIIFYQDRYAELAPEITTA
ncbi:hypothetical protein RRG08_061564 [Elysia crispata]|uniref:Uncharacterized protein n=1 Tax=Elysia crispata TaxID=231223 RepID=A0AAE0YSN0_9GAST|nr:hypothetical protein RRG08_061564 [Elysia crispata]